MQKQTAWVPIEILGAFIGQKGSHIRNLQQKTSCYIKVNSSSGKVQVFGPTAKVAAAKILIRDFIFERRNHADDTITDHDIFSGPRSPLYERIIPRTTSCSCSSCRDLVDLTGDDISTTNSTSAYENTNGNKRRKLPMASAFTHSSPDPAKTITYLTNEPNESRDSNADIYEKATGKKRKRSEKHECVVCLDAQAKHAMVPCGHLCVCGDCAKQSLNDCPVCRGKVDNVIRIYWV